MTFRASKETPGQTHLTQNLFTNVWEDLRKPMFIAGLKELVGQGRWAWWLPTRTGTSHGGRRVPKDWQTLQWSTHPHLSLLPPPLCSQASCCQHPRDPEGKGSCSRSGHLLVAQSGKGHNEDLEGQWQKRSTGFVHKLGDSAIHVILLKEYKEFPFSGNNKLYLLSSILSSLNASLGKGATEIKTSGEEGWNTETNFLMEHS